MKEEKGKTVKSEGGCQGHAREDGVAESTTPRLPSPTAHCSQRQPQSNQHPQAPTHPHLRAMVSSRVTWRASSMALAPSGVTRHFRPTPGLRKPCRTQEVQALCTTARTSVGALVCLSMSKGLVCCRAGNIQEGGVEEEGGVPKGEYQPSWGGHYFEARTHTHCFTRTKGDT